MAKKRFIQETFDFMPKEEIEQIEKQAEEIPFEKRNYVKRKAIFDEDDEIVIVNDNFQQLKNELKAEIIRQGYKSVTDFANKNHGRYSAGTIKMNLANNKRYSETVLAYISTKLGFNFRKKVIYELEK